MIDLRRFEGNPIIQPIPEQLWESKATFNPAAFLAEGKVHIVYRAMSIDNTSTMGYATSHDGLRIDERLTEPIYIPREKFEKKLQPGNSGCEDPRITLIDDRVYMCYTAVDAQNPTRVALSSISLKDFLAHRWRWDRPYLISPPGVDDKNACILSEKIDGKYCIFHRIDPCIWIDYVEELNLPDGHWVKGDSFFKPRTDKWDSHKIGIAAPPIKTDKGWLLLYHGVAEEDRKYRVGAMLLAADDPTRLIARTDDPILGPEEDYEKEGQVSGVVFPCGAVVKEEKLFVYYGGADKVVGVASLELDKLLAELTG